MFLLVHNPQVGIDARVEEFVLRHLDDGFHPILVEYVLTDVALATACIAAEKCRAVVYLDGNTLTVELPQYVLHEQQLSITHSRQASSKLTSLVVVDLTLESAPLVTVWWIGNNHIKLLIMEWYRGQRIAVTNG